MPVPDTLRPTSVPASKLAVADVMVVEAAVTTPSVTLRAPLAFSILSDPLTLAVRFLFRVSRPPAVIVLTKAPAGSPA